VRKKRDKGRGNEAREGWKTEGKGKKWRGEGERRIKD